MIRKAAAGNGGPKPDLVVLPVSVHRSRPFLQKSSPCQECFNSLYGAQNFPVYAETIGYTPGEPYDIAASQSDSVKMLSAAAKDEGIWIIGGLSPSSRRLIRPLNMRPYA